MPGLFTCLKGPSGTSKNLIMTARFACLIEALESNERLLWLTRTRKQRNKALRDARQILSDRRLALGLGRRDDTSACDSDCGEWDGLIVEFVEACVGPILAELHKLQEELSQTNENIKVMDR